MKKPSKNTWLLQITTEIIRFFLLAIAGCTIAHFASAALELHFISIVLVSLFEALFIRILVLVASLVATTAIVESLRH